MEKLTVIIPFLNEGNEIENTLRSIRETAKDEVDILLVDDDSSSYHDFDYKKVADYFGASYIKNATRMGVGPSRDIGVAQINTKYFLIVDGHMRFYNNNWWHIISEVLTKNDRNLYCCKCKPLDVDLNEIINKPSYGAYINFGGSGNPNEILSAQWIRKDFLPDETIIEIPCVLGACYAASKEYWQYLKGLSGLQMYGSDEPYISLKVWLEGGKCMLIKDVEIGHIYRNQFPYHVEKAATLYNKYLIAKTLLPDFYGNAIIERLNRDYEIHKNEIYALLSLHDNYINELKGHYDKITTRQFTDFWCFNNNIKNMNNSI